MLNLPSIIAITVLSFAFFIISCSLLIQVYSKKPSVLILVLAILCMIIGGTLIGVVLHYGDVSVLNSLK